MEERAEGGVAVSAGSPRILQFVEGGSRYGAAVSILRLTEALARRGADVRFAVFEGRPLGQIVRDLGIPTFEVKANRRFDFRGMAHLAKLLRQEKIDVLHTHLSRATIVGSVAAKLARVPVVATVHGMNRKYTYMLADHVVTVSEAARRHLVEQGMHPNKITPIYNGLDLRPFDQRPSREEARRQIGSTPGELLIGTVSRAEMSKGIREALEAIAIIRAAGFDAKYVLVGEGRHLNELKEVAVNLGIGDHVRFAGFQADVMPWLSAFDLFLFPTKQEAFGISVLEAMACALPIVTTRVGGVPEVVDDRCARLVATGDSQALALAALELLGDRNMAVDLATNAAARVRERFTMDHSAARAERLYREMVGSADSAPVRDVSREVPH